MQKQSQDLSQCRVPMPNANPHANPNTIPIIPMQNPKIAFARFSNWQHQPPRKFCRCLFQLLFKIPFEALLEAHFIKSHKKTPYLFDEFGLARGFCIVGMLAYPWILVNTGIPVLHWPWHWHWHRHWHWHWHWHWHLAA